MYDLADGDNKHKKQSPRCCGWGRVFSALGSAVQFIFIVAILIVVSKLGVWDANYAHTIEMPSRMLLATASGGGGAFGTRNATCYDALSFINNASHEVASGTVCVNPQSGVVMWSVEFHAKFVPPWNVPLGHLAFHGPLIGDVSTAPTYVELYANSGLRGASVAVGAMAAPAADLAAIVAEPSRYYIEVRTATTRESAISKVR